MARPPKLQPFFKYIGSKYLAAPHYPRPRYDIISEYFCGAGGYATRNYQKKIFLFDIDPRLIEIWRFLIASTFESIMDLPLLAIGQDVSELNVSGPALWFIQSCLNVGAFKANKLCAWAPKCPGAFWGLAKRSIIARQVHLINHWEAYCCDYSQADEFLPAEPITRFIDPPYQALDQCYDSGKGPPLDYEALGTWCRRQSGQVIVCELDGADWLPFKYFRQNRSGRGKHKRREVIWTNDPDRQIWLPNVEG